MHCTLLFAIDIFFGCVQLGQVRCHLHNLYLGIFHNLFALQNKQLCAGYILGFHRVAIYVYHAEFGEMLTLDGRLLAVYDAFADGEQVEVYHDGAFVTYATVAGGKISYEVSHFCEIEVKAAEEVELDNTIDSVKEFMAR